MGNELYHYGVLGMQWGKRKKTSLGNRYHSRAAQRIQKDADDLRKHGFKSEAEAVQKVADKERDKAVISQKKQDTKQERKQAINKAYNELNKNRSTASKLGLGMYNDATYRKAAKNMVNKGMDQKTALSKAKMSAWRNTGMTVVGTVLYMNRDKLVNDVRKYANAKAIQRANAGLARIGTMKLTKVAGNVYEYKMR